MSKLQIIELPARLWKLQADVHSGTIGLEFREQDSLQANFALITPEGEMHGPFEMPEKWWVTLDAVIGAKLLVRSYEDHANPQTKKLWLLDTHAQEILWEVDKFLPNRVDQPWIYGHFIEGDEGKFAKINMDTAAASYLSQEKVADHENGDKSAEISHYVEGTTHFEQVHRFLSKKVGDFAVKAIDYFQSDGRIIISYYIYEGENLINKLHIFDREGTVLHHDILGTSLPTVALQSFFVLFGQLIFVNRHNQLSIYEL
ncbi:DUF4905 domain-containing protein [Persicobacter psychrovividus]|uniref:DUF4905 domain-containing protein n=1 Tax=Persicobacter psychrovividus TaxID=387638 RepID=A0ABM7VBS8_9BACT|nr:hypothetical protein PEPS_06550 [Persicobacter psychrovividus]